MKDESYRRLEALLQTTRYTDAGRPPILFRDVTGDEFPREAPGSYQVSRELYLGPVIKWKREKYLHCDVYCNAPPAGTCPVGRSIHLFAVDMPPHHTDTWYEKSATPTGSLRPLRIRLPFRRSPPDPVVDFPGAFEDTKPGYRYE